VHAEAVQVKGGLRRRALARNQAMEIPVLLEALPADGYRATTLTAAPVSAKAPSRQQAPEQVCRLVQEQFARGEVVRLQVALPGEPHAWHPFAGTWKDHPDTASFEERMRKHRCQVDADPERL
jgi:hypothetical protein